MSHQTPEEIVDVLLREDEVFKKYFTTVCTPPNLAPQEEEQAKMIFKRKFPNYPEEFEVFYHKYCTDRLFIEMQLPGDTNGEIEEVCPNKVFDGPKRGYVKIPRISNFGRGRQEKFNLSKYLRTKRENGDFFQLSVGDHEMTENFLDQVNEERLRNESPAIIGINAIAEKVAVLNPINKYKVMELHPEKRVE